MENQIIYGVDTSQKVTPIAVRNAIIECFAQAHQEILNSIDQYDILDSEEEIKKMGRIEIEMLVKKAFEESGANYEDPDKKDMPMICEKLAEYAENFRQPDIIKKHYGEIMHLVDLIEEEE